eukprot:CAMPEP_0118872864 /NCGR_PEP_ID=MMETSP1163-20130328/14894_1 /TAXON_ID=124430 /ORGANISM="Phaeomonas parva, Strain CCMP2877" /LENGTH=139 /DNA_ID=CAMNT_0006808095 /DNA_START=61 /DNA_END=480 /DNA_ORIENTATION=-
MKVMQKVAVLGLLLLQLLGASAFHRAPLRRTPTQLAAQRKAGAEVASPLEALKALGPQLAVLAAPALALADEVEYDDIAYGTVEAPGWVLPVVAVATIGLTALVPLILKPGDDAAREMQERDADVFGSKGYGLNAKDDE